MSDKVDDTSCDDHHHGAPGPSKFTDDHFERASSLFRAAGDPA